MNLGRRRGKLLLLFASWHLSNAISQKQVGVA